VPEGDTLRWHANRIRPVLEGQVPDAIRAHPRFTHDRWGERLEGRRVNGVDAHGKHLFVRFDGGLTLHSHLGMVGTWAVYRPERRWGRSRRRAWLVMQVGATEVVQFDGPTLELVTEGRTRFDQRLAALGPDVLEEDFDAAEFLRRLRLDDPTRPIGDALLDQRTVAGIGNMWKAEGCWEAEIDPWRPTREVSDDEVMRIVELVRPRMMHSVVHGPRVIERRVYGRLERPCLRCGTRIASRGQWEDNRSTYWCPGCQH
jgi:endonuclease-8